MGDNLNGLADLFRDFSDSVGGYWSDSNRQFDSTNPGVFDRIVRTINPITGLGSAAGSMYDYSQNGDLPGMALSALSAMPAFGFYKMAPKSILSSLEKRTLEPTRSIVDLKRLILSLSGQVGANEVENQYRQ